MKFYWLPVVFLLLLANSTCSSRESQSPPGSGSAWIPDSTLKNPTAFLHHLEEKTFWYFWNEANPENGLVRDRSTVESPASIATTGFGLVAWATGAENGWVRRLQASERTLTLLKFFLGSEQSENSDATGYRGFYYHFLNWETGRRMWDSELSTIDTALLFAGFLFARQYYRADTAPEREIRQLTDRLLRRADWDFFTLPDTGRYAGTLSLGWKPESGFSPIGWVGYNEALILYIIAAGLDYTNSTRAYRKWLSFYDWREPYPGLAHVVFPPLFGHHYSHIFVDFRNLADGYLREKGIDYFENSRRATLVQRRYAVENPLGWTGYDSLGWGLTACDGPGSSFNQDGKSFYYYTARGTSGPELIQNDDGTIAPSAAGGSVVFAPQAVIPTLQAMYTRYGRKGLWGKYGFVDAFNPTVEWFDRDYLGIDQAAILLMIENYRSELIWKYTMRDPVIRKGLRVLGFESIK